MSGSIYDWSTTPLDNATADAAINYAEGQSPSTVNNSSRQVMARVAELLSDLGANTTVGGTADAITLTTASAFTALASGLIVAFRAGGTNTGAVTLDANSLGAKAIRKFTTTDAALTAGDMVSGGTYLLIYDEDANGSAGAWVLINPALVTGSASTFLDSAFRVQDNADATKQVAFEASGITTGNTRTLTVQDTDGILALLNVEDQTVSGGARVTSKSLGTITTGTVTLDPGDRPLQHYTNNGAHTLAPGSNTGSIILDITNGASAGAITVSGWTKVVGAFNTTNTNKFRCSASIGNTGSLLTIQAMQ